MIRPTRPLSLTADPTLEPPPTPPAIARLALRLDEIAESLGVSRRSLERARASGKFPKPDIRLGRTVLWTPETIAGWLRKGGNA